VFEASAYSSSSVAESLADLSKRTWVAEQGGELLGYAHVGPTKLPHPDARPDHGELYQLYLRRSAQGLKLGGRLLTLALDHLEAAFTGPLWIGVWSGNHRAQAIYRARGFEPVGEYGFPVGAWIDAEIIMRRERSGTR
jgi:ribosomal protein S18 acetylase RimI-like enzyme